jgi:hypothetical protein
MGRISCQPFRLEAETVLRSVDHGTGSTKLGLTDSTVGLDIGDDRVRRIDQIVVGIGEEGWTAQRTGPLGRRSGAACVPIIDPPSRANHAEDGIMPLKAFQPRLNYTICH